MALLLDSAVCRKAAKLIGIAVTTALTGRRGCRGRGVGGEVFWHPHSDFIVLVKNTRKIIF